MATHSVMAQESLTRAVSSQSVMNYQSIFEGFAAKGIPEDEIKPRENVFTFWAWKALGRRVKKGEHGVKACTFVPVGGKDVADQQTGEVKRTAGFRMARTTTVFHISQTEPEPSDSVPEPAPAPSTIENDPLLRWPGYRTACDPSPVSTSADARIARFRSWADALETKIEHAGRPMTQNPTPKRNREYQSRLHDCRNMERLQKALRVLADGHEDSSIPHALAELRTKDEIGSLVRKYIDHSQGGYYSCIEASDYANTSPDARLLQSMIDGNSAQRAERERLRKLGELEAAVKLTTIPGYFPTPAPVVSLMLQRARIQPGMLVLEPSAGTGNIADALKAEGATVHVYERSYTLREILELKGHSLSGSDFMEALEIESFDRILMNPPFEKQQDIDHVRKAYTMLKPGGILVAIMAPGFEFRSDSKSTGFRQWLEDVNATWENLPSESFKASGTGVETRLVVIDKVAA